MKKLSKDVIKIIAWSVTSNQLEYTKPSTIKKYYIKFCLGKLNCLKLKTNSLHYLLGFIFKFIIYGFSIWKFISNQDIVICIIWFLTSLCINSIYFISFISEYVAKVIENYTEEIIKEYEKLNEH